MMTMVDQYRKTKLRGLLYRMRQQFPVDLNHHTRANCRNSCGGEAIGGDECPHCLERQIAQLTTATHAKNIRQSMRKHAQIIREAEKALHGEKLGVSDAVHEDLSTVRM